MKPTEPPEIRRFSRNFKNRENCRKVFPRASRSMEYQRGTGNKTKKKLEFYTLPSLRISRSFISNPRGGMVRGNVERCCPDLYILKRRVVKNRHFALSFSSLFFVIDSLKHRIGACIEQTNATKYLLDSMRIDNRVFYTRATTRSIEHRTIFTWFIVLRWRILTAR